MTASRRWNHNIHYHRVILEALPDCCDRVLDAGCGEGLLASELSTRARHVTGIDVDADTVEAARRVVTSPNVELVVGDLLTHPLEAGSFDALVSVAALHHMDTEPALRRMADLLRPGGRLAIVGLARSNRPVDLLFDAAGAVATRVHRIGTTRWESSAPTVWPPRDTYSQVRRTAATVLGDAGFRRLVLWRYLLTWTKPHV